jgi:hypothetical protein
MSFAQITRNQNPRYVALEEKLVREGQQPQTGVAEPVIIMEAERQQAPTHLYVIWREWANMSLRDRSKLILNAYEKVQGANFALNVTVALGLTPEEAELQGIEYVARDAAL